MLTQKGVTVRDELEAMHLLIQALSYFGGIDPKCKEVRAWAFCVKDATPDGLRVVMAKEGTIKMVIEDGWILGTASEFNRRANPGNRYRENNPD